MSNWWRTSLSATQPTAHPWGEEVFRFKFDVLCITALNAPRKRLTFPLVRRSNCSQCIVSRAKPSCEFSSGLFLKLSAQNLPWPAKFPRIPGCLIAQPVVEVSVEAELTWNCPWLYSAGSHAPWLIGPPPPLAQRRHPMTSPLSCPEAAVNHSHQK